MIDPAAASYLSSPTPAGGGGREDLAAKVAPESFELIDGGSNRSTPCHADECCRGAHRVDFSLEAKRAAVLSFERTVSNADPLGPFVGIGSVSAMPFAATVSPVWSIRGGFLRAGFPGRWVWCVFEHLFGALGLYPEDPSKQALDRVAFLGKSLVEE